MFPLVYLKQGGPPGLNFSSGGISAQSKATSKVRSCGVAIAGMVTAHTSKWIKIQLYSEFLREAYDYVTLSLCSLRYIVF